MMRLRTLMAIAALAVVPRIAAAQQPVTAPPVAPASQAAELAATSVTTGWADFGARTTSTTGDSARYERYRDLGNGLFLETLRWHHEQHDWQTDLAGDHVERLDQRLRAAVARPGRVKAWAMWDQIPMLMSRSTQTLFTIAAPNVLTIPDVFQAQVAAASASAQAGVLDGIVRQAVRPFDLESRRHIGETGVEFQATKDIALHTTVSHSDRDGAIPFGGSFGHSNVVETIAPVRQQLTDVNSGAEYARGPVLLRGGYTGSWFHNDFTSLTFDNPWRAVDSTAGGSAGQLALPPSNSFATVNGFASVKMRGHTRASIYLSTGFLQDAGAPLLPFSINTTALSGGAPIALPRTTSLGDGRTTSVNATFSSRPTRYIDIDARYRTYHYDNRTPEFDITQRVAFDNAVSNAVNSTEPLSIYRKTFDADARVILHPGVSAGAGFSRLDDQRTFRIFDTTREDVSRAMFDVVGMQWLSVRTKFEHSNRRGHLDTDVLDDVTGIAAGCSSLNATTAALCAEQPDLRQYDIANRQRNRVTVLGSVTPFNSIGFNVSAARGRDTYPDNTFGLRSNDNNVYSAGVSGTPSDHVAFELSYSYENYLSSSGSRQANPGLQFFDSSRDWTTDGHDTAHSIIASLDILKIRDKVDVKFAYDFNRAQSLYAYRTGVVLDPTLPEDTTITTSLTPAGTPCGGFTLCLPLVKNQLQRASMDVTYTVNRHFGLGVSYWYERYRVTDWSLDAQAIPNVDLPGALLLGYQYLPYTAGTLWGHILYRW